EARGLGARMQFQNDMDKPLIGGLAADADDLMEQIGFIERHGDLMRAGDLREILVDAEASIPCRAGIAQSERRAAYDSGERQGLLALAEPDGIARQHEAENLA